MLQSELFCVLPNYVCTPDGMAIDRDGNLVIPIPAWWYALTSKAM